MSRILSPIQTSLHIAADILPGFTYARSAGRYRSLASGRFVARSRILDLLRTNVDAHQQQLTQLTTAFHEGRIAGAVYVEQSRTILRRLHLQNSALGAGGFDRLTQVDYGRIGGRIRQDYAALTRLQADVEAGTVTLPQALNRTAGMVGNARTEFWSAERDRVQRSATNMVVIERNLLAADAQHCTDCQELYDRGWQMEGVIPVPGTDRICQTHCRCTIERREVPANEVGEWLGTHR